MAHLGKRAHSQKAIEGVSGLFDSQDEPMRMVYFSQLVEVSIERFGLLSKNHLPHVALTGSSSLRKHPFRCHWGEHFLKA